MELIEILTPLIINAVTSAMAKDPAPSTQSSDHTTSTNVVSTLPLPVVPTSVSPRPSHSLGSVNIPFQVEYYGLTGQEKGHISTTLPEITLIKNIINYYQHAEVVELEAVLFSGSRSYEEPVTIDLLWSPADVVAGSSILSKPGAVRFTIGGLNLADSGRLPCPLQYINRVIKSPISYSNSPRLNVVFHPVPASKINTGTSGSLIIRGIIKCSTPTVF